MSWLGGGDGALASSSHPMSLTGGGDGAPASSSHPMSLTGGGHCLFAPLAFKLAVGIIVAHKKTEFQCRRRLKAERSAWNGDTNFGLEDRFDDQASEACSYWVRILAGQTAMSQTVDCALDARLLCKQVYRSIIPTSGVDHTRS